MKLIEEGGLDSYNPTILRLLLLMFCCLCSRDFRNESKNHMTVLTQTVNLKTLVIIDTECRLLTWKHAIKVTLVFAFSFTWN